jgi:hypothetical protein
VEDNLLAKIPGDYVAKAAQSLPPAATATFDTAGAMLEVPNIGKVRLTFDRFRSKRGKAVHYFWRVKSAELIAG